MEFEIRPATQEDDLNIRELLRELPMPADITLTYEREPDYFLGAHLLSKKSQIQVAVHTPTGRIAGLGTRSIRTLFVNDTPTSVGYISHLRVAKEFQGRWLVSRGMKQLRELHRDGQAPFYLANIVDQNMVAMGVMVEKPRKGFPTFRLLGRIDNLALLSGRPAPVPRCGAEVRSATAADLPGIVGFLNANGPTRQFFPAVETTWFGGPELLGLKPEDFVVAVGTGGEIIGTAGMWDQAAFKQTVVRAYRGVWSWARHPYNIVAPVLGLPPLPAVGERIRETYAALVSVKDDDETIFRAILRQMLNAAARGGYTSIILGLDVRDPLFRVAKTMRHISYRTSLYLVFYDDGRPVVDLLDGRIPFVEPSCL